MPCTPLMKGKKRAGFLCVGNDPVEVKHGSETYRFEWTSASGWCPVNKDCSERLSPVPKAVWAKVDKLPRPENG